MRIIVGFLMLIMFSVAVFGNTIENTSIISQEAQKYNFYQEADITFFQTFPFMVFWGQVINLNLFPGQPMNFGVILASAAVISLANGIWHADKVVNNARASNRK